MSSVGIIAEYNPFHNGHLYHLNKIKEMYPDDTIVLVMSSSFTQRGEVSILDKFSKTDITINMGIDLVVELPFVFSTQSADFFSYGALSILESLGVEKFVFGSESNDISQIETLVDAQLENEEFDSLVKVYLSMGENYPTSLSKALVDLTGKNITLPNDLLGISYVKTIKKNNFNINPICIKRTNDYHDKEVSDISSATAIREALKNNEKIDNAVPKITLDYLNKDIALQEDYFKFLKYKIMSEDNLSKYHSVDEGLDNRIKETIIASGSYEELIDNIKTKRYTRNRINRMLTHILCSFTKKEANDTRELEYVRVLGFSKKGQTYLNRIKKDCTLPIISNFSKNKSKMLEIEFRVSSVYASIFTEEKKISLIEKEFKHHPNKSEAE